jgi:peroxiredoxin Q/BCP
MLAAGDTVPAFDLLSSEGAAVNTGALGRRRVVLYLYPKDDTSGCTVEACSFRDNLPDFTALGIPVFGVSPDELKAHAKFSSKHGLNFALLSDPGHQFIKAAGAWVEKNMYGRKYMGVQRSTFLIGPDGRVEHVWGKVKPAGHAQEVLAWLQANPSVPRTAARSTKKITLARSRKPSAAAAKSSRQAVSRRK